MKSWVQLRFNRGSQIENLYSNVDVFFKNLYLRD